MNQSMNHCIIPIKPINVSRFSPWHFDFHHGNRCDVIKIVYLVVYFVYPLDWLVL